HVCLWSRHRLRTNALQGRDNDHRRGAVARIATECGPPSGVTREEMELISKAKTARSLTALDGALVESVGLAGFSRGVVRLRTVKAKALIASFSLVFLALAFSPSALAAGSGRPLESSFGSFTGSDPQTIAVDQSNGDIYVADTADNTVQRYDS